jgi:hypothetical protein
MRSLAAQLLHTRTNRGKVVSSAGSGHVPSLKLGRASIRLEWFLRLGDGAGGDGRGSLAHWRVSTQAKIGEPKPSGRMPRRSGGPPRAPRRSAKRWGRRSRASRSPQPDQTSLVSCCGGRSGLAARRRARDGKPGSSRWSRRPALLLAAIMILRWNAARATWSAFVVTPPRRLGAESG